MDKHIAFTLQDLSSTFTLTLATALEMFLYAGKKHKIPQGSTKWRKRAQEIINSYSDPNEFENQVEFLNEVNEKQEWCDCCGETCYFSVKDNTHEFYLSLTTILQILYLCERKGYLNEPCKGFWLCINNQNPKFNELFDLVNDNEGI